MMQFRFDERRLKTIGILLLISSLNGCYSNAASFELANNQASHRQTVAPTPTPLEQDTPTQEEIAEEAARQGYGIHRGRYINYGWGYSVLIPEGYVGIKDPAPNPAHGFTITLARRPESEIRVYNSYDGLLEHPDLDEQVNEDC